MGLSGSISFDGTSSSNSSVAPLTANSTFTGTAFDNVSNFSFLTFSVISDVASATNGLKFQWSSDGINIDREETTSVSANSGRAFSISIRSKYFRVVYINGATNQTSFRLQTVYHHSGTGIITKPLKGSINEENFAQLVQSAIVVKLIDNTYTNIAGFAFDSTSLLGTSEAFPLMADRGKGFEIVIDGISVGATSEEPLVLIDNPSGSGKKLLLETITFGIPTTGTSAYRVYVNPTITANGTLQTPVGSRQTGQSAAVVNWYTLPTASAFGSKFFMCRVDSVPFLQDWNLSRFLETNNKILITVVQSVASQAGNITALYTEV
jgi:hypothetical protein